MDNNCSGLFDFDREVECVDMCISDSECSLHQVLDNDLSFNATATNLSAKTASDSEGTLAKQNADVEDEEDVIFVGNVLSAHRESLGVKKHAVKREDGEISTSDNSLGPVVVERDEEVFKKTSKKLKKKKKRKRNDSTDESLCSPLSLPAVDRNNEKRKVRKRKSKKKRKRKRFYSTSSCSSSYSSLRSCSSFTDLSFATVSIAPSSANTTIANNDGVETVYRRSIEEEKRDSREFVRKLLLQCHQSGSALGGSKKNNSNSRLLPSLQCVPGTHKALMRPPSPKMNQNESKKNINDDPIFCPLRINILNTNQNNINSDELQTNAQQLMRRLCCQFSPLATIQSEHMLDADIVPKKSDVVMKSERGAIKTEKRDLSVTGSLKIVEDVSSEGEEEDIDKARGRNRTPTVTPTVEMDVELRRSHLFSKVKQNIMWPMVVVERVNKSILLLPHPPRPPTSPPPPIPMDIDETNENPHGLSSFSKSYYSNDEADRPGTSLGVSLSKKQKLEAGEWRPKPLEMEHNKPISAADVNSKMRKDNRRNEKPTDPRQLARPTSRNIAHATNPPTVRGAEPPGGSSSSSGGPVHQDPFTDDLIADISGSRSAPKSVPPPMIVSSVATPRSYRSLTLYSTNAGAVGATSFSGVVSGGSVTNGALTALDVQHRRASADSGVGSSYHHNFSTQQPVTPMASRSGGPLHQSHATSSTENSPAQTYGMHRCPPPPPPPPPAQRPRIGSEASPSSFSPPAASCSPSVLSSSTHRTKMRIHTLEKKSKVAREFLTAHPYKIENPKCTSDEKRCRCKFYHECLVLIGYYDDEMMKYQQAKRMQNEISVDLEKVRNELDKKHEEHRVDKEKWDSEKTQMQKLVTILTENVEEAKARNFQHTSMTGRLAATEAERTRMEKCAKDAQKRGVELEAQLVQSKEEMAKLRETTFKTEETLRVERAERLEEKRKLERKVANVEKLFEDRTRELERTVKKVSQLQSENKVLAGKVTARSNVEQVFQNKIRQSELMKSAMKVKIKELNEKVQLAEKTKIDADKKVEEIMAHLMEEKEVNANHALLLEDVETVTNKTLDTDEVENPSAKTTKRSLPTEDAALSAAQKRFRMNEENSNCTTKFLGELTRQSSSTSRNAPVPNSPPSDPGFRASPAASGHSPPPFEHTVRSTLSPQHNNLFNTSGGVLTGCSLSQQPSALAEAQQAVVFSAHEQQHRYQQQQQQMLAARQHVTNPHQPQQFAASLQQQHSTAQRPLVQRKMQHHSMANYQQQHPPSPQQQQQQPFVGNGGTGMISGPSSNASLLMRNPNLQRQNTVGRDDPELIRQQAAIKAQAIRNNQKQSHSQQQQQSQVASSSFGSSESTSSANNNSSYLGLPRHLQWQLNFANFCSKSSSFNTSEGDDGGDSCDTSTQQQFCNNQQQEQLLLLQQDTALRVGNSSSSLPLQMPIQQSSQAHHQEQMRLQPQTSFSTEQMNYFVQMNMKRQQPQNNPIFGMTQMVNKTNLMTQQQQPAFISQMNTNQAHPSNLMTNRQQQSQPQAQPQPLRMKDRQTESKIRSAIELQCSRGKSAEETLELLNEIASQHNYPPIKMCKIRRIYNRMKATEKKDRGNVNDSSAGSLLSAAGPQRSTSSISCDDSRSSPQPSTSSTNSAAEATPRLRPSNAAYSSSAVSTSNGNKNKV